LEAARKKPRPFRRDGTHIAAGGDAAQRFLGVMTLAASVNSARDRSFLSAIFEKLLRSRSSAVFWARYRRTIYLAANIIATNILSRVLKARFAQEVPIAQ
jgi:hypothetical protein